MTRGRCQDDSGVRLANISTDNIGLAERTKGRSFVQFSKIVHTAGTTNRAIVASSVMTMLGYDLLSC